tara:strand:+ start:709 stop:993 length:285 start_codon:yes stop_codon:yes gene_type:complete
MFAFDKTIIHGLKTIVNGYFHFFASFLQFLYCYKVKFAIHVTDFDGLFGRYKIPFSRMEIHLNCVHQTNDVIRIVFEERFTDLVRDFVAICQHD